jgi:hypothetical protein
VLRNPELQPWYLVELEGQVLAIAIIADGVAIARRILRLRVEPFARAGALLAKPQPTESAE